MPSSSTLLLIGMAVLSTASTTEWVAKPIPLFLNSSGTTFALQPEGLAFLSALGDTKVAIVSVGGQARAGKSFLLNNVLNASHDVGGLPTSDNASTGFGVGSSFHACTKGVWLWGQPTFKTGSNGERVAVVYMDTEGLGAMGNIRDNQDPKLALFSALFSSSFYYVVHRVINQESIDFLHSVAVFAQKVGRDLQGGIDSGSGAAAANAGARGSFPFASLFWVVQSAELCENTGDDGVVNDADDLAGRARCAESMVATALTPKIEGSAPKEVVERYNDVVSLVTTRFAQLPVDGPRAMAMTHPKTFVCPDEVEALRAGGGAAVADAGVAKCRKLRGVELPHIPYALLDGGYRAQVDTLRRLMAERAAPKSLGVPLTGNSFGSLATRIIGYFNSFNGTVDRGILAEFAEAVAEEAAALFKKTLRQGMLERTQQHAGTADSTPTNSSSTATATTTAVLAEAVVAAIGTAARAAALAHFDERCPGADPTSRLNSRIRTRLEADIGHALAHVSAANVAAARAECQRTLATGFASSVGRRALSGRPSTGAGASDGAFASQQAYAEAKDVFRTSWLASGCALPTDEATALWAEFESTHVSLHDVWVARDAGRSAVRGLRRSLVQGAGYSTVGAAAVRALLPVSALGTPRWARLTVSAAMCVRNLFVGGALALTASDLNLAPELIDGAAVEAALTEAAPHIGALLSAADALRTQLDGVLAAERAVRGKLLDVLFAANSVVEQQQQQQPASPPVFSVLQHLVALVLEALAAWAIATYGPGYLEQARVRAEERKEQRLQQQETSERQQGVEDQSPPSRATEASPAPKTWSVKVAQPLVVHSPAPLAWRPSPGRMGQGVGSSSKKKRRRFTARRAGLENSVPSPAAGADENVTRHQSPLGNISNTPSSFYPSSNIKASPGPSRLAFGATRSTRRTTMRLG